MKFIFLTLTFLMFTNCIAQQNEKKYVQEITKKVRRIDKESQRRNSNLVFKDVSEGNVVSTYTLNEKIVKIESEGFVTMGKYHYAFYFQDYMLIFSQIVLSQYNKPFYYPESKVERKDTIKYFFKNLKAIDSVIPSFKQENNYLKNNYTGKELIDLSNVFFKETRN